ncbi:Multiple epidermal growth factor-like domains protein 8 [Mortierella sp. 14UC]|nr:Multiple epidermal growth factor-like domains protein 8 [Mortierella sp. 14UC]
MAYTTVDEKTLFIHGGITVGLEQPQFFSLDLTQDSWDVSSPPWKTLVLTSSIGGTLVYAHTFSTSPDGRTLTVWMGLLGQVANYNIADNKWTQVPLPEFKFAYALPAATDPTTGTVYIPAGAFNNVRTMVKYNIASGHTTEPIPSSVAISDRFKSFVWSKVRKSFILHAYTGETAYPFYEYTPSNAQWKVLSTTGLNPPFVEAPCIVPAYEGTKVILFGGLRANDTTIADIYILDVPSLKWTKGRSAPGTRVSMACAVAGDNFIVWGGESKPENKAAPLGTPMIYNINTGQWVQKYVRGSSYKSSSAPSPLPTSELNPPGDAEGEAGGTGAGGNSKGVNGAAIGGGVAGAAVVIAAIAFLFVRRRRHNQSKDSNTERFEHGRHYDQDLPSLEDTDAGSSANARFKWNQIQKTPSSPQLIRNDPQGTPSSPHSNVPSPLASSPSSPSSSSLAVPPLPSDPLLSTDRQKRVRSMDQQLLAIQEQIRAQRNNPQYDPTADRTLSPSTVRGPQGGGEEPEPVWGTSTQEIRYQIESLQAELNRRGAV